MVELTSSAPKHKRKYVLACDPHATSTLVDIPTARCLICAFKKNCAGHDRVDRELHRDSQNYTIFFPDEVSELKNFPVSTGLHSRSSS